MELQTLAAVNKWRILSSQYFVAPPDVSKTDAKEELVNIRGTGRVLG